MIKRGEFKVATQSGPKGYFGKVGLEIESADDNGAVIVDFDQQHARSWQSGARFGIDYVLEHVSKKKLFPKGVRVHIRCIEGHEVDTTNVLIAYVTIKAFLEALGEDVVLRQHLQLDTVTGSVAFPK